MIQQVLLVQSTRALRKAAVVNANCSYTDTPNSGYIGADSFTFIVVDVNGVSSPAQVSIAVNETVPVCLMKEGPKPIGAWSLQS